MENISKKLKKEAEKYLKDYYPELVIFEANSPIKIGIHTTDFLLKNENYFVRVHFYSPPHKGEKGGLFYWIHGRTFVRTLELNESQNYSLLIIKEILEQLPNKTSGDLLKTISTCETHISDRYNTYFGDLLQVHKIKDIYEAEYMKRTDLVKYMVKYKDEVSIFKLEHCAK